MKPICARLAFCFSAVRFLHLKKKTCCYTAYPLRTVKRHCDASSGVGGTDCSWNIIFFSLFHFATRTPFWMHLRIDRKPFPPDAHAIVVEYFRRFTWRTAFLKQYYGMILEQGPRPYVFQPMVDQFRQTNVQHNPLEIIISFLVG